jgi:hypothetical protein
MLHVFRETLEVTPIRNIIQLIEMSLKSTMAIIIEGVSLVQYIWREDELLLAGV